ncbi:thioredoxin [Thalassospiraceae bacterium LMO-JJ14]|nr:thioredoxin [Thalassospiraceae bacterium LMO-JJ14]
MEFVINPDGSMSPKQPGSGEGDAQGAQPHPQAAPQQAAPMGAPEAPAPGIVLDPSSSEGMDARPVGGPAGGELIKDSDTDRFMADVIDASAQVPVIVDFWAPWCGPCKQLGPMLEKLVREAGGTVRMVKINVDENQQLAAQMRVQSIPAVYAFKDGQPVDGFMGALPESQLKTFIEKLTGGVKGALDQVLEQADAELEGGDALQALALYGEAQQQSPENEHAIAGMIRAAVAAGENDTARDMIEGLPEAWKMKGPIAAAISAFQLEEETEDSGDLAELQQKADADPADLQARYDLALAQYAAKRNEAAIDTLLEIIARKKDWNDGAAREQLIKIFDALGPTHELTTSGRRRLSSVLFS